MMNTAAVARRLRVASSRYSRRVERSRFPATPRATLTSTHSSDAHATTTFSPAQPSDATSTCLRSRAATCTDIRVAASSATRVGRRSIDQALIRCAPCLELVVAGSMIRPIAEETLFLHPQQTRSRPCLAHGRRNDIAVTVARSVGNVRRRSRRGRALDQTNGFLVCDGSVTPLRREMRNTGERSRFDLRHLVSRGHGQRSAAPARRWGR